MTQNDTGTDRRKLRSRFAGEALGHWLEAVARRAGSAGMVVADADGLLVGSAGARGDELAAFASAVHLDGSGHGRLDFHGSPATVRGMDFEGYALRVCALGEPAAVRSALDEAVGGILRILRGDAT